MINTSRPKLYMQNAPLCTISRLIVSLIHALFFVFCIHACSSSTVLWQRHTLKRIATTIYPAALLPLSPRVQVLAVSPPQDTYVNFFGVTAAAADAASTKGTFYFLSGDENSLTTLGAQVGEVVFDTAAPTPSTMTLVSQDTKAFTLSNLHMSPADGSLYGVSPGLYGQTGWSLVKETFATGAVAPVGSTVAGSALFASWYGGGLSGYVFTSDGGLAHVFRHALDGSLSLCTIDVTTGLMRTAPTLLTGVNGATSVTGVTAVMAA